MSLRITIAAVALLASGCASIDLPELDMLDSAFRDSAVDLEAYPEVGDAPVAPTDMRSSANWDMAAKMLIRDRETFNAPAANDATPLTPQEIEALKAKVRAYKLDDPV